MKFTVNQLKPGDVVRADVVEEITPTALIVSFEGDLLRVANESQKRFHQGQQIKLQVAATNPLSFRLISGRVA